MRIIIKLLKWLIKMFCLVVMNFYGKVVFRINEIVCYDFGGLIKDKFERGVYMMLLV